MRRNSRPPRWPLRRAFRANWVLRATTGPRRPPQTRTPPQPAAVVTMRPALPRPTLPARAGTSWPRHAHRFSSCPSSYAPSDAASLPAPAPAARQHRSRWKAVPGPTDEKGKTTTLPDWETLERTEDAIRAYGGRVGGLGEGHQQHRQCSRQQRQVSNTTDRQRCRSPRSLPPPQGLYHENIEAWRAAAEWVSSSRRCVDGLVSVTCLAAA